MLIKVTTGKTVIEYNEETNPSDLPQIISHYSYGSALSSPFRGDKMMEQIQEMCNIAGEAERKRAEYENSL